MEIEKLSKFLSLVLSHKPETIGTALDEYGWSNVEELLRGVQRSGRNIEFPC